MKSLEKFTDKAFYILIFNTILLIATMMSNQVNMMWRNIFLTILILITSLGFYFVWELGNHINELISSPMINKLVMKTFILLGVTIILLVLNFVPSFFDTLESFVLIFFPNIANIYIDNLLLLILLGWNFSAFWYMWKQAEVINLEFKYYAINDELKNNRMK